MDSYPTKSNPRQKKDKASEEPWLLDELLFQILLRLPVLSLLRFTLVCRRWDTMIKSPRFIRDHCRIGSMFTSNLVHWQDMGDDDRFGDENMCSIFPDGTAESYEVPPLSGQFFDMHGACDGIICCDEDQDKSIVLWNPATRNSRTLPSCPYTEGLRDFLIGFGSDPITNYLKIVIINKSCQQRQFYVYNLTGDSWNSFEDGVLFYPDFYLLNNQRGRSYSNGVYYWVKSHKTTNKARLLAFDMRNHSFEEMEMPMINQEEEAALDFFDDTLALLVCQIYAEPLPLTVWLMKERGCWIKHKTVLLVSPFGSIFGVWKENQIYSDSNDELILYDLDSGYSRSLGKIGFSTYIFRFKESLILV